MQIVHAKLRSLYAYWQARRDGEALPARGDLDPLDMGKALGNIGLVDVRGDPPRLYVRLWGSNLAPYFGGDWHHCDLEEALGRLDPPELRLRFAAECERAIRLGQPRHFNCPVRVGNRAVPFEMLILPLGRDHHRVDMLMVGAVPPEGTAPRATTRAN